MSKLNKAILIFILSVLLLVAGAWNFIQTKTFSSWLASQTKARIYNYTGVDIHFEKIALGFFPLNTRFHQVELKRQIDDLQMTVSLKTRELAVNFSLFDLLSSKITIESIELSDGDVSIKSPLIDEWLAKDDGGEIPWQDIQIESAYRFINEMVHQKLPVDLNGIVVNKSKIQVNDHSMWVNAIAVRLGKRLKLNSSVERINILNHQIDSVDLVLTCDAKQLNLEKMTVKNQLEAVTLFGSLRDGQGLADVKAMATYTGGAKQLFKFLAKYQSELKTVDALWKVKAEIKGKINNPDVRADITANDLRSEFVQADTLTAIINKKNDIITLDQARILRGEGSAQLTTELILWDGKKAPIENSSFNIVLDKFYTNDALYYIRDTIDPLKGVVSGEMKVSLGRDGYRFELRKGSLLEHFALVFDPNDGPILSNKKLEINTAKFFLANDMTLAMDLDLGFGDSRLVSSGFIRSDSITIEAQSTDFDFKQFGAISGAQIEGKGNVDLRVEGPFDDVKFLFDIDLNQAKVVDLALGDVEGRLRLDLKDLTLHLNQLQGRKGSSKFSAQGSIRFEADQRYNVDVSFPQGTYRDALSLYEFYLPMQYMPKGLAFSYQGKFQVAGSLKDPLPNIQGEIQARNLTWFNESADKLDANFTFINGVLTVNDFMAQKRVATLSGKIIYDLSSEYLEYSARLANLRLQDIAMYRVFNFGYDGILEGNFKGDGKSTELITQSKLKVVKGNIFNQAIQDSTFVVYSDKKNIFINGSILGSIFTFDSYLNLDQQNQSKLSYINASLNTSNVKILTGFISDHNSLDNSITGRISANLESSFNFLSADSINLLFEIDEFAFKRENIRLVLSPIKKNILIKSGEIRHWDILLKGKNALIQSVGTGNLHHKFAVSTKLNVDASVLEMIFPRLQKSSGPLLLDWSIGSDVNQSVLSVLRGETENVLLKVAGIPDTFENLNLMFQLAGNRFDLMRFKSRFGDGQVEARGDVEIKLPYPSVNFTVDVDQTRINFFKNSSIVLSGLASVRGAVPPYEIKSDVSILYGELLDEFSEYQVQGAEKVDSRYIPKPIDVGFINFFSYDVGVKTLSPLLIRNQMADIQVMGAGHVGGSFHSPSYVGDLSVVQGKSRFLFKGHEFTLTEGKLSLGQDMIDISPAVKLTATSKIQNYDVKVDVAGKVDNFDFKLTSEPALSQQDILSLLTLGVTSDIANNLDDTGRKSITSLSLGSLIVDQFMLNRGLDSASAIKLSLLPEFGESSGSLLHGRTSGAASSTKMKSATKVKLQTKVAKNVDLSFSSTLGGSMNQKQEMQVNYDLGSNMTIKGIYELEDPETGSSESGTSLGIDFNYRKTFK